MNSEEAPNSWSNPYVPGALLALALCVFFFGQMKGAGQNAAALKWQNSNADGQIATLRTNREKLDQAIEERKALVEQSEVTQKQFTDLMTEVDRLARSGDKDAKLIIDGYGIKVNEKPAKDSAAGAKGTEAAVVKKKP